MFDRERQGQRTGERKTAEPINTLRLAEGTQQDKEGRRFRTTNIKTRSSAVVDRSSNMESFMFPPSHLDVFITCLPGLESILSLELKSLEIRHVKDVGGVRLIEPKIENIMECHLFLGTASNILLRCTSFVARGLAELRRKTSNLPWRRILKRNIRLEARVLAAKSKLYHTTAIRNRIFAGIYEALGYEVPDDGERIELPFIESETVVRLDIRVYHDNVEISIDTSCTPVHKRGYRLETSKAPLREDLAFAMLFAAGWLPAYHGESVNNLHSNHRYTHLLDPFCGSGTIVIEAAAMAAGLPPGRLRNAPFDGTRLQNPGKWRKLVNSSIPLKSMAIGKIISASDRDAGAVGTTIANSERAGVRSLIEVQRAALASHPWLADADRAPTNLLIASNPPFGKRISRSRVRSAETGLLPLYQTLGHRLNRLIKSGRKVGTILLTNDLDTVRRTGLADISVAFKSCHGGLDVFAMLSPWPQDVSCSKDVA